MTNVKLCSGCRNDFYNGNNEYGIQKCWSVDGAKIAVRFRISVHTPMGQRSGYEKVKLPDCYHQDGFVFLNQIPNYAR